nr:putative ribonuclease H-like domain-containing protein [Tanacetum cinerariifolium]
KQEFVKTDTKKEDKKANEKKRDMRRVKCYNSKKEGHFAKDCKKAKVKDYEYYKTKMLLAKKDKDEQVMLAEDQAWMDNETAKDLWDALERHMRGSEYGEQDRKAAILYEYETFKAIEGEQLLDTYLRYLQVINDLKKCGYKKDNYELNYKFLNNLQPEWKRYDSLGLVAEKMKVSKRKEKVVVSLDSEASGVDDFNELKKITALLAKAFNRRKFYSKPTNNNLRTSSTLHSANKKQEFVKTDDKKVEKKDDEKKRDMSKTKMLLAKKDSDEQVLLDEDQARMESSSDSDQEMNANMVFMAQIEKVLSDSDESSLSAEETIPEQTSLLKPYVPTVILEKIIIDLEDEVVNLLEKEKVNLKTIESLKSKGFESSENAISELENQSENDCQVVEIECENMENPKVIAHGKFKLNLDTFSSVRRPKHSGVIWKKKGSSNTSNVDLSSTSSAYVCHDALNVSCNTRMCDLFDENNLFIFDDESVRISPVSKMPFRKKPRDSMNVRSKSNSNKSLSRTVHTWLPKLQPLAELVAKWFLRVKRKIHRKHHKSKTAFALNKPLSLLHMDLCGLMRVESIYGKRYVLVVVDDYSRYTCVFFFHSKDEASDVIISFIKKTQVNLQLQVHRVRTDNGTEFKNKTLTKFFDK